MLPPVVEAISGSAASAVGNIIIYPLDLVTTRLQTQGKRRGGYKSLPDAFGRILHDEGLSALYSGVLSDTLSTALSNFIFFYVNVWIRKIMARRRHMNTSKSIAFSPIEEIALGSLSGIAAKLVTLPLSQVGVFSSRAIFKIANTRWLQIVVRLQTSAVAKKDSAKSFREDEADDDAGYKSKPNMQSIVRDIYQEKGITGFWSGMKSACILTLNPSITLYLFELFKRVTLPRFKREHPPALVIFFASSLASSIAAFLTYPLILGKTRLQWRSPSMRKAYGSVQEVWVSAYRQNGFKGLFDGLQGQVLKNFVSEGCKMTTKERIELVIIALYQRMYRQET